MKRFAVLLACTAILACGEKRIPTIPIGGQQPTYVLFGSVRDSAALPVAGATVLVPTGNYRGWTTTTNQAGFFKFIGVTGAVTLRITQDAYEPYQTTVDVRSDTTVDLRVRRLIIGADTIELGRTIRSYVFANAVPCDPVQWDARAPCRKFYFTPSSSGLLALELKWTGPPELDVTIVVPPNTYVASSTSGGTDRMVMTAYLMAGVRYELRVNSYYGYQVFDMTATFTR